MLYFIKISTLQIDSLALFILLVIWLSFRKRADLSNKSNRLYVAMLKILVVMLVVDCISVSLYGVAGAFIHLSLYLLMMVYFVLNPLLTFFWMLYVHECIFHNEKQLKKFSKWGIIPVILNTVLSVGSIFNGYLFYFGSDNNYYRGQYFFIVPLICFGYIGATFVMTCVNKKRIRRKDWLPLLAFGLPPLVGMVFQMLFYGLTLILPAITLSLMIIYIFIQLRSMNVDHLTGLNNRREFDYHIDNWMNWIGRGKKVAGFMLDLDDFKEVNDTFGHHIGDLAIIDAGEIIRKSFRSKDFVARLGGDEFAVVLEVEHPLELEEMRKRLEKNLEDFNQGSNKPYQLSISIGGDIFEPNKGKTIREFFHGLDQRMYQAKEQKKQKKGSEIGRKLLV